MLVTWKTLKTFPLEMSSRKLGHLLLHPSQCVTLTMTGDKMVILLPPRRLNPVVVFQIYIKIQEPDPHPAAAVALGLSLPDGSAADCRSVH